MRLIAIAFLLLSATAMAQVTSVTGGTGISTSPTTGDVTVTNTAPLTLPSLESMLASSPYNIANCLPYYGADVSTAVLHTTSGSPGVFTCDPGFIYQGYGKYALYSYLDFIPTVILSGNYYGSSGDGAGYLQLIDASSPSNNIITLDAGSGSGTFTGAVSAQTVQGIVNAATFPGTDIGQQINNTIAAYGGACIRIVIPTATYNAIATQIKKPQCVELDLQGSVLNFDASTQPLLVLGNATSTSLMTMGALRNGTINGTSTTGNPYCIWLGGDSTGTHAPTGNTEAFDVYEDVTVQHCASAYTIGSNTYQDTWRGGVLQSNVWGIISTGQYFSENLNFHGIQIVNNTGNGVVTALGEYYFFGASIDYNNGGGVYLGGTSVFYMSGGRIEQQGGLAIGSQTGSAPVQLTLSGVEMALTSGTGTDTAFVNINGTNSTFVAQGVKISNLHPVTEFVNWQAAGSSNLFSLDGLTNDSGTSVLVTNASPNIQNFTYNVAGATPYVKNLKNESLTSNSVAASKLLQNSPGQFGGTCTPGGTNTCTFTIAAVYSTTPLCVVSEQGTDPTITAACSVTGTTVTVTTSAANSDTWAAILIGNPN